MGMQLLEALLRIRINLNVSNKCCKNFVPSEEMFELFNSSIYNTKANEEVTETQVEDVNNVFELFEDDST